MPGLLNALLSLSTPNDRAVKNPADDMSGFMRPDSTIQEMGRRFMGMENWYQQKNPDFYLNQWKKQQQPDTGGLTPEQLMWLQVYGSTGQQPL